MDDRKSIGGYAIFMGATLVSRSSKKYHTIAILSTKSNHKIHLYGVRRFLSFNQPRVSCTHEACGVRFPLRDKVAHKDLIVQFLSLKDQLADVLTKPLTCSRFELLRSKLNVSSP
ncbi:hypothetical protein T459_23604 [Capsicum annuum]|uniref:Uncharacterized protein n=1 Tax=Capsicum annuum TaxID=4072 RepID=A0A2G2YSV3_CAPAN|nr:hypothetical protein T459_23604 [Capsicum annuum]